MKRLLLAALFLSVATAATWGALDDSGFTLLPADEYVLWTNGNGPFDWFWLSPETFEIVPEPSEMLLAFIAAGGLLVRRKP